MPPATAPSSLSTASQLRAPGASSQPAAPVSVAPPQGGKTTTPIWSASSSRDAMEGQQLLLSSHDASALLHQDRYAAGRCFPDVVDTDEDSVSYTDKFGSAVGELRAQVEMMVLSTDGNDGMRTCVLRPSYLFGPGDSSLVSL